MYVLSFKNYLVISFKNVSHAIDQMTRINVSLNNLNLLHVIDLKISMRQYQLLVTKFLMVILKFMVKIFGFVNVNKKCNDHQFREDLSVWPQDFINSTYFISI